MLTAAICLAANCSSAQQRTSESTPQTDSKKILIVYLSRTNNTKAVAGMIHENVGGTLVAIELEKPYPADYQATVRQVEKENQTGYLPPLKTKVDAIEQYDVIFLGFPTWGMQMPPPMKSFLRQYSLKGKTLVPFNTHAGYGVGSGFATVKELCPDSTILESFVTRGGIERDGVLLDIKDSRADEVKREVRDWLRKIKILQ